MAVVSDDRMRVRAQAKWVRTSARKARVVLEHIRGRSVPEARTILAFTQRAAATDIEKVLRSASGRVAISAPSRGYGDDPGARKASQARTQGAPISVDMGATEDAAWHRFAAGTDTDDIASRCTSASSPCRDAGRGR